MSGRETISHEGVVVRTTGKGSADVEILAGSACSGCHVKSACSLGNTEVKIINVKSDADLNPGDKVTVTMELSQGFRALMIGYVIPFLVLMAAFIAFTVAGAGELVSALTSFAAVGIYYFIVWLLRKKVEEKFEFKIKN